MTIFNDEKPAFLSKRPYKYRPRKKKNKRPKGGWPKRPKVAELNTCCPGKNPCRYIVECRTKAGELVEKRHQSSFLPAKFAYYDLINDRIPYVDRMNLRLGDTEKSAHDIRHEINEYVFVLECTKRFAKGAPDKWTTDEQGRVSLK